MIESRCGLLCSRCSYREESGCKGCTQIGKPFWGEQCPVKSCCEGREQAHCGQCAEFPCKALRDFAYDKVHGDGDGRRIDQCKRWTLD